MASISSYKLKNGKTRYQFTAYAGTDKGLGKQKQIHKRGFKTAKAANDAAKIVEANVVTAKRQVTPTKTWSLGEYLDYWIENLKVNVKEGSRLVHKENINTYIKPRIGNYPLTEYSLTDHQRFINNLFTEKGTGRSSNGLSWNTVHTINATLSSAFRKAQQLNYVTTNPTVGVEFNRKFKPKKRQLRYYTQEQVDKFLDVAKGQHQILWYPFFTMMFDCGLRVGENLALRWSRVDLKNKTIKIDRTRLYRAEADRRSNTDVEDSTDVIMLDDPKTEHSARSVPLTMRAYNALVELKYEQQTLQKVVNINPDIKSDQLSDFVFRRVINGELANPISAKGSSVAMARIADTAHLPRLNIHGCRHTFGVRLRESGVSLDDIQDLMGHKDPTTTRIYAEVTPKVKDDAMAKLNDYLNNTH